MKRIVNGLAALAAAAVIALPACGNKTETKDAAETTVPETPAAQPAPAAFTETGAVTEVPTGTENLDAYSGKLIIVDFNALWCGPCRQYAPVFHAVASRLFEKATFLSVNIDSCAAIKDKYVGQYIPQTTAILPDGRVFNRVGELTEDELTAFVDSVAAL